jgi:hypothetical protein
MVGKNLVEKLTQFISIQETIAKILGTIALFQYPPIGSQPLVIGSQGHSLF